MVNRREKWGSEHLYPRLFGQRSLCNPAEGPAQAHPKQNNAINSLASQWFGGGAPAVKHAPAAVSRHAIRNGSAVGHHVSHLDEAFIDCLLGTSGGHILHSVCWTMKIQHAKEPGRLWLFSTLVRFLSPWHEGDSFYGQALCAADTSAKANDPLWIHWCVCPGLKVVRPWVWVWLSAADGFWPQ